MKDRTSQATPAIKIRDSEAGKPVILPRIATGKELMNFLAYSLATYHNHPEPRSIEEAELIADFFRMWSTAEIYGTRLNHADTSGQSFR